ncbi:hypothetical protein HK097_004562 [Rhizophlyctis rosea]|uniref:Uncharacterized protein n=1 Tax=Rhizophlyctis rosea TaxID=64517 RepID=A0AAD5X003_9FUNG|nr:hypothetical protein HK097_004562 [Rhizophlyctis rosea]
MHGREESGTPVSSAPNDTVSPVPNDTVSPALNATVSPALNATVSPEVRECVGGVLEGHLGGDEQVSVVSEKTEYIKQEDDVMLVASVDSLGSEPQPDKVAAAELIEAERGHQKAAETSGVAEVQIKNEPSAPIPPLHPPNFLEPTPANEPTISSEMEDGELEEGEVNGEREEGEVSAEEVEKDEREVSAKDVEKEAQPSEVLPKPSQASAPTPRRIRHQMGPHWQNIIPHTARFSLPPRPGASSP